MTPTPPYHFRSAILPLLLAVAIGLCTAYTWAAGGGDAASSAGRVAVSARPAKPQAKPSDQIAIAVVLEFEAGWHAWPNQPPSFDGFEPIPTTIEVSRQPAWVSHVGPVQWPATVLASVADPSGSGTTIQTPTLGGRSVAFLPIILAPDAPAGEHELVVEVGFQACDETHCDAPELVEVPVRLTIAEPGAASSGSADPAALELFAPFDSSVFAKMLAGTLPAAAVAFNVFGIQFSIDPSGIAGYLLLLAVAAVGGLLLNFTPCVLPVIPIKILGLSASAGNPARCLYLGTVMSLGVIAFWLGLGAAIATISGFDAISSLFQQSWFSIAVGVFIGVMGVGMLGLYTVSLPKAVYLINPSHETTHGSFVFGIMTAVLSTPCTAPLMGTAAAWATKQAASTTMTTFGAIGAGMALPYFLLAANPRWVAKMPRTGPASELVKQVMGVLMLAVATFFLGTGVVARLSEPGHEPSRFYWWLIAGFALLAGGWLIFRTFRITPSWARRIAFGLLGIGIAGAGIVTAAQVTRKGPIDWVYHSPEVLKAAREGGKIIVVDFTAEWCLNCKALEEAVLNRAEVARAINAPGVVALKVDLTANNPEGRALLREAGSVAIPFLAIYGAGGGQPVFTSDAYTPDQVLAAIARARGVAPGSPSP